MVVAEPAVLVIFPATESLDQILFLALLHQQVEDSALVTKEAFREPEVPEVPEEEEGARQTASEVLQLLDKVMLVVLDQHRGQQVVEGEEAPQPLVQTDQVLVVVMVVMEPHHPFLALL
ncbi:MAG: hypothetical protein EBR82_87940 [Caulobacteraceae bacterium]|nr:hypothetical protein [Caulobacteraceae bacterium]